MKLKSTLRIGRGADCDLRIEHDTVSHEHATLQLRGDGRFRLRDLGSSNGTFHRASGRWVAVGEMDLGVDDAVRFGERETTISALLEQLPELALALGEQLDGAALEEGVDRPRHERPRRNPRTGDIEETR